MPRSGSERSGDGPPWSSILSSELVPPDSEDTTQQDPLSVEDEVFGGGQARMDAYPSRRSLSVSTYHKTPARSYFQSSFQESHVPIDITKNTSESVRQDTAALASWALADSNHTATSPCQRTYAPTTQHVATSFTQSPHHNTPRQCGSSDPSKPDPIQEVSESTSSATSRSSSGSHGKSALTDMLRRSRGDLSSSASSQGDSPADSVKIVTVNKAIISQPTEQTSLLLKRTAHRSDGSTPYSSIQDLESLKYNQKPVASGLASAVRQFRAGPGQSLDVVFHPKRWSTRTIWDRGVRQPLSFIPPVILGLLLNVLDALSYGMILFPLSQPPFTNLGPDGISMFYVSCIVSQLVYSCGGSGFKGGTGSEMIEVVPFFHKMAFTILNRVGEDRPKAVVATTVLSYAISSIMTGATFFIMGQCKIGTLIGFFPRHILLGCIGGVGLFLVATGLEVSGRLEGSFEYDLPTLQELTKPEKLPLWMIPLALAIILLVAKRWIKHPLIDASYFNGIIGVFYFFILVIPDLQLPELRCKGWVFEAPEAGVPFYHFYSLYNFEAVDWGALGSTVPAMLALTFFGILHVPINIPALGLTTGEDNVDIDRELRAHGVSNALSGFCGSIQNYLVYTNTVLFMRSGGDSRVAGVLLALATCGILLIGTSIIGYVPVMVVGSLIFFLGIDLIKEALVDTWGRVHRIEYVTIVTIVITMGVFDFVVGILVGIVLACVSFVLQTSQISAVRGKLFGGVANSTVRRHPVQQRFLQDAGKQIHVMKLAGYLFFGTIVGVENQVRALLEEVFKTQPIRFLILDLFNVDGVDFSAAEAFNRIRRILNKKNVSLVVCGMALDGEVGGSLRMAGLFDGDDVQYFLSLNSALESCENELLKAFYHQREAERAGEASRKYLEVPRSEQKHASIDDSVVYSSPRQDHLHHVASMTLKEPEYTPATKWETYQQPLQLILQTFSTVSDKPEDFWKPAATYFQRKAFLADDVVYNVGEPADGFYLLESGMFKAKYDLPQGKYSELLVAGTTCGELPFFSSTTRTSTTTAERDCVTWNLDVERWSTMQKEAPKLAQELLKISLKLTSERMDTITKYMLLTSG